MVTHTLAFVGFDDAAELGIVVAAMFAILVLAALYLIITLFGSLFRRIPVVGTPIADGFDAAARWVRGATLATWHGVLWAGAKVFHAFSQLVQGVFQAAHDAMAALEQAVEQQAYTVLPREIGRLDRRLTREISRALMTAMQYTTSVRQEAHRWYQQALAYSQAGDAALRGWVLSTLNVYVTRLYQLILSAEQQASAQVAQAEQQARALVAQAEMTAIAGDAEAVTLAVHNAMVRVDGEAAGAAATVWAGLGQQVAGLETQIGTDFPDLARLLQLIPTMAPAGLAAVLAAVMSFLPPIMQTTTDCVIPTCRDLGPLRDLSHILASVATDAALLAWLIYCVSDPAGAAADTAAVADPIAATVMDPLLTLLQAA